MLLRVSYMCGSYEIKSLGEHTRSHPTLLSLLNTVDKQCVLGPRAYLIKLCIAVDNTKHTLGSFDFGQS